MRNITMNRTPSTGYSDLLSEYAPMETTDIAPVPAVPASYTEQKGVMQIIDATSRYYAVLDQGEDGTAERAELVRIAQSMENVTGVLAGHANVGLTQTGMGEYVQSQTWGTKTPESVVGKVCANLNRGRQSALHDLHRGMLVIDGTTAEVFAEALAASLNSPDTPNGTIAYVTRFESPHSDELIREESRKVIVGFQHEDGNFYTGEIQIHDTNGYKRYCESRIQYENRRGPERADAMKKVLGGLAVRAEITKL